MEKLLRLYPIAAHRSFQNPGHLLVDVCISQNIDIITVPGANSLLPALIGSGFDFENFYYRGWLSPKKHIRRKQLLDLKRIKEVIVLMDTPYRLQRLLADVANFLGKSIPVVLAFELTILRMKNILGEVLKRF